MRLQGLAIYSALVGVFSIVLALSAPARGAVFTISWTGSNNWTMTGTFSFADALLNTGPIDATNLDSFAIQGFHGGVPVGSWNMVDGHPGFNFNFNFDTTTQALLLGGFSTGLTGQEWDVNFITTPPYGFEGPNPGLGFFNGTAFEAMMVNNREVGNIFYSDSTEPGVQPGSHLLVTRVPEPTTLALLGIGLAGLGFSRRKQ